MATQDVVLIRREPGRYLTVDGRYTVENFFIRGGPFLHWYVTDTQTKKEARFHTIKECREYINHERCQ